MTTKSNSSESKRQTGAVKAAETRKKNKAAELAKAAAINETMQKAVFKAAAPAKKAPATKKAAKAPAKKAAKKTTAKKEAAAPKAESKGGTILALIARKGGATAAELQEATGWQAHSVRGFLSTAAKKGLAKIASARKDGVTTYSIG